ncbi:hypothetical protein JCM19992_11410 [Thermostilla marina]
MDGQTTPTAATPARTVEPRAQSALRSSPIVELQQLRVVQDNDRLLISGVVSSFYHKQLAQEVVRAVLRDADVHLVNEIEVLPDNEAEDLHLD